MLYDVQGLYTRVRRFYGENRACVSEADFYGIFSRFVADFVKARQRCYSSMSMYYFSVFFFRRHKRCEAPCA